MKSSHLILRLPSLVAESLFPTALPSDLVAGRRANTEVDPSDAPDRQVPFLLCSWGSRGTQANLGAGKVVFPGVLGGLFDYRLYFRRIHLEACLTCLHSCGSGALDRIVVLFRVVRNSAVGKKGSF